MRSRCESLPCVRAASASRASALRALPVRSHFERLPCVRASSPSRAFVLRAPPVHLHCVCLSRICMPIFHSNCASILNRHFPSDLHSAHQTIPRSPQPLHVTDGNPRNDPRLHFPLQTRPLFTISLQGTSTSSPQRNVTILLHVSHNSITATTATWSSNSHHSLEIHGGDVGQVISGNNLGHECALELVSGPTGSTGISLKSHLWMEASARSGARERLQKPQLHVKVRVLTHGTLRERLNHISVLGPGWVWQRPLWTNGDA